MRVASSSNVVKLHEIRSGQLITTYEPIEREKKEIRSISWNLDGTWMAIVPNDKITQIVSFKREVKILTRIKNIQSVVAVFSNTSKRKVAIATTNREVLIYDIKSREICKKTGRKSSEIKFLEFTANDSQIALALTNGQIYTYNNDLTVQSKFSLPNSKQVTCLKCPNWKNNYIGAGSDTGIISLYDTQVNKIVYSAVTHFAAVNSLTYSPFRLNLTISTGMDKQLIFNDAICSGKVVHVPLKFTPTAVSCSNNGYQLVVSGEDGKLYIYDTRSMNDTIEIIRGHDTKVNSLAVQKSTSYFSDPKTKFKHMAAGDSLRIHPTTQPQTKKSSTYIFNQFVNQPTILQTTESADSIRKLARKEIKQETRKLHMGMHSMLQDISHKIQCEVLDLQMAFGKSFVQVENNLSRLKQELSAEEAGRSTELLVQQNNKLKREVMVMREKMAGLVGK